MTPGSRTEDRGGHPADGGTDGLYPAGRRAVSPVARFRRLGRRQDDPAAHEPDPWLDDPRPGPADRFPGDRTPVFDDGDDLRSVPATRSASPALWAPQPWTSELDDVDDGPVTDPFGFPPVPPVVAPAAASPDPGPAWAAWVPRSRSGDVGNDAVGPLRSRPAAERRDADHPSVEARDGAPYRLTAGAPDGGGAGRTGASSVRGARGTGAGTGTAPDGVVAPDHRSATDAGVVTGVGAAAGARAAAGHAPATGPGTVTDSGTATGSGTAAGSGTATGPGAPIGPGVPPRPTTATGPGEATGSGAPIDPAVPIRPGTAAEPGGATRTAATPGSGTVDPDAALRSGTGATSGPGPVSDDSASPDPAEASALAGAFAADYLSWDEDDPARRGRALADHLPGAAADRALLGWSGTGRQRAEIVLPGAVRPDGDGRLLVDVRVRVTPYRRVSRSEATPEPDEREALGTPAAAPSVTARGWRGLAARWVRLGVTVVLDGERLVVDAGEETVDDAGVPDEPPARSLPAGNAHDPTLDGDDVEQDDARSVR